jgi:hypothetical protein
MVALANLYTILDVSIQQLAMGVAILPFLVALAWYVSHPAHRLQLSAAACRPGARLRLRGYRSLAGSDVIRRPVEAWRLAGIVSRDNPSS